ncbi:hypothetical protein ACLMJK_001698 [Lecanora helva]
MALPTRQNRADELPFERLLKNNNLGIIENPLRRLDEDDIVRDVQKFHQEERLSNVVNDKTMIRGGLLAADEEVFKANGDLSRPEELALESEKESTIWQESKELKIILLTCFVASIVQGWGQGAIVGANQQWPNELGLRTGLTSSTKNTGSTGDIWRFSATNAIVYFSASTLGAFLCDPLTEIVTGRRGALFVAGLFTFGASVGAAYVQSWQALFATRVLLGIGMGAKTSVVPVYESEVSPARLRGQFLVSWQTGTALGIAFSAMIPLIAPHSWRFQISSSFIPSAVLLFLVFVGSESPRWLIKKQRYAEAYRVLLRLRGTELLAARDLYLIRAQLMIETILFMRGESDIVDLGNEVPHLAFRIYQKQISLSAYGRRILQLFTIPRARRSTVAAFVVMSAQQLSGINIFAFLAATLFDFAGISDKKSLWLYFGFGMANFISSAVAYFYIDTKGRRFLLMASLAAMVPLLLATGFSFLTDSNAVKVGLVSTFLILYTFAYSPGAGVVPFLYTSEIFPQVLREVGMAWGSAVTFFGAGILALVVPQLIHAIGQTALLGLFAGLDAIALFLVWLLVPGTEQQVSSITMEEMNYVFGVATRTHVHYQVHEVAPWFFQHYFTGRKTDHLDPLYRYAKSRNDAADRKQDVEMQDC